MTLYNTFGQRHASAGLRQKGGHGWGCGMGSRAGVIQLLTIGVILYSMVQLTRNPAAHGGQDVPEDIFGRRRNAGAMNGATDRATGYVLQNR